MIFWRQKVLLALLEKAPNQKASKIQFLKWLFLLKEEDIDSCGSFYDFLPYKYGPFSFSVYREITEMESYGWIRSNDQSFQYSAGNSDSTIGTLSSRVLERLEKVLMIYGKCSQADLIEYVYKKHPWYASRSIICNDGRNTVFQEPQQGIYALGYEGLSIDAFLNIILKSGIRQVIDSRNNPISRKYGFAKSALEVRCSDIGVKYFHFPQVGIPSSIRYKIQEKEKLWSRYRKEILREASTTVKTIGDIVLKEPSMVICFEKAPQDCHRHILVEDLSQKTGLPVLHYDSETHHWQRQ